MNMDVTTTFEAIESIPFMVEMDVVSSFKSFFRNVKEQPAVQQLREATATEEGPSLLFARIKYLCTRPVVLVDTALAVYLDILYDLDKTLAKEAAALVYPLSATYWSYGISQAILTQDENQTQVGE
jgi:hypothetical protein